MENRLSGSPGSSPMLAKLLSLVDPPASGGTPVDWERASREYTHGFPRDYIEFMAAYGEGVFDDFLVVHAPFPDAYPNDPSSTVHGRTADARLTGEEEDYDAPELLIGWGLTVDSDLLCWRMTDADPDRWTSVIWRRQWTSPDSWVELDCGMAELLCRWATNQIPNFGVGALELPYSGSRFVGYRDRRRLRSQKIDPWGPDPVT